MAIITRWDRDLQGPGLFTRWDVHLAQDTLWDVVLELVSTRWRVIASARGWVVKARSRGWHVRGSK